MPDDDDETLDLDPAHATSHKKSEEFAAAILSLPGEPAQVARVRELARIEPWSVSEALLSSARACARRDPGRATTLAGYAVLAAEEISPALHPESLRDALLASAFCYLAKACRLAGRLAQAEEALRSANFYLVTSASDLLLNVRVLHLSFLADLRANQGLPEEAEDLRHQAGLLEENLPT
jgi:hypothetical protein